MKIGLLNNNEVKKHRAELSNNWEVIDSPAGGKKIAFTFKFKTFKDSIDFVNKVAVIAEQANHHPNIHVHYNKVRLSLTTHSIGGLSENDFIVAAKIERTV